MKNKKKLLFFFLLIFPWTALANTNYVPMEPIPGFSNSGDLPTYLMNIYRFGIWAIGISAPFMITIGGIMYITSAGNTSSMGNARNVITDAIIGLIMALSAYLILYVINPDLVKMSLPTRSDGINMAPDSGINIQGEGGTSTNSNSSSKGPGNPDMSNPIVAAAEQMRTSGCSYNQSLRNGCKGNPGYTDCSNMIDAAYQTAGLKSPGADSAEIMKNSQPITDNGASLGPGDIIVVPGHTVLCGTNGCSQVIAAAGVDKGIVQQNGSYWINQPGARVVRSST